MSMNDIRRTCRIAAKLVEKGWSQHRLAFNGKGEHVDAHSPEAESWCAMGALYRAGFVVAGKRSRGDELAFTARSHIERTLLTGENLMVWNDKPDREAGEVADLFKGV